MSTNEKRPVIICSATIKSFSRFYLADHQVRVDVPQKLINQLLAECDGIKTYSQIVKNLSVYWDEQELESFMAELEKLGVICDSSSISDYVWSFVKNPTRLFKPITDKQIAYLVQKADKRHKRKIEGNEFRIRKKLFQKLLEKRRSVRTFSNEQGVPQEVINLILWSAYGIVGDHLILRKQDPQRIKVWQQYAVSRHTVPSAGALYPFQISLVLLRPTEQCLKGIYNVAFEKKNRIKLVPVSVDCIPVLASFADPMICNQAQGIIILSGSFNKCGEKYGNRSMLYLPLEAGHIAQNIHLSATDLNIGTLEVGGFLEESMRDALQIPNDYYPLTSILFGHPETKVIKQKLPEDIEVSWASQKAKGYKLPFLMAFARPKKWKKNESACGRSVDPEITLLKALSEAEEWSACGRIPNNLLIATYNDLSNAIDPREIVRFHQKQYRRAQFVLEPFNPKAMYYWNKGEDILSGRNVYILADCIYFPFHPNTPRYCFSNSSGTATHTDRGQAIKIATMELIERESFMISYLNRLEMPTVETCDLPDNIQKRLRALNRVGFKVAIKDMTMDLAPVAFVFAQNHRLPLTTCAGCCDFDFSNAIDHALMEVESAVYCRLIGKPSKALSQKEVRFTDEHGNLYEQSRYYRQADFLGYNTSRSISLEITGKSGLKSWHKLIERLDEDSRRLIVVDLLASRNAAMLGMRTVKVFIPGIVPISFGYGVEPLGMKRIYDLPVKLGLLNRPKSYRQLEKFPHPYT